MQHSFDTEVAKNVGVIQAIMLNNIYFWIKYNEANKKHFHDGTYWTFNSKKSFKELFPYLTARQISYALDKLVQEGYLKTGNYNELKYDRTLWYALTEKGLSILQNCQMECTNSVNRMNNSVQPIPDINTDNKPDINTDTKDAVAYDSNEMVNKAILDFIEFRKKIKSPMTDKAIELMIQNLNKLASSDEEKIEIINQSIMNGWKGIFELKQKIPEKPPNRNPNQFNSFQQRNYSSKDINELEKQMLGRKS